MLRMDKIKGTKNSKNRIAVLDLIKSENEPVSADYIYQKLRETNPNISMSTVYRILELLTRKNILFKTLILDDNKARYEIKSNEDTHYLICLNCGKMLTTHNCHFQKLENKEWKDTGFLVTGHKVELYGQCADCRK
jgi:Fur family ferric uptake transcriptional regulator